MMRHCMVALSLSSLSAVGWSQGDPGLSVTETRVERARIDSVRLKKSAELDAEEAACLSRFATTDCQNQVGVRRRQMLSELKHQETVLNTAEREQRGIEQLHRAELKSVDNNRRQRDAQLRSEKRVLENRQKSQEDKQRAHLLQAQPAKNQAPMAETGPRLDAKTIKMNQEAYSEKQRSLEKRRQERDLRLLEQGKDVRPLPLPP